MVKRKQQASRKGSTKNNRRVKPRKSEQTLKKELKRAIRDRPPIAVIFRIIREIIELASDVSGGG